MCSSTDAEATILSETVEKIKSMNQILVPGRCCHFWINSIMYLCRPDNLNKVCITGRKILKVSKSLIKFNSKMIVFPTLEIKT
jgi:hypothetical protein